MYQGHYDGIEEPPEDKETYESRRAGEGLVRVLLVLFLGGLTGLVTGAYFDSLILVALLALVFSTSLD